MFEEITSSPQFLTTCNFLKGGDFMVEAGPDPKSKNTSFPERNGRIRIPSAVEIATTYSKGQPVFDRVVFLSVSRMDAGE